MALRTLGSSLIGKAGVGSRTRELTEQQIATPNLPEKGQVGTISRELVQDPLERPVPAGSNKLTAQQPLVESAVTALPGDILDPNIAPPAPGDISGGAIGIAGDRGNPNVPNGGANQALFQGGVSPAGRPAPSAGKAPTGVAGRVSGSTGGQAQVASAYKPTPSPSVNVLGAQSPSFQRESIAPALGNLVASKAFAEEGNRNQPVSFTPTTGQFIAGGAGRVASAVGNAINNPGLRSLGNQLQSFGGQPTRSAANQPVSRPGSVSSGLRSLASNVGNTVRNVSQNISNFLRSFNPFRR